MIAGGVAQAGDVLFKPLRHAVAARTSRMSFDASEIVPAALVDSSGLVVLPNGHANVRLPSVKMGESNRI